MISYLPNYYEISSILPKTKIISIVFCIHYPLQFTPFVSIESRSPMRIGVISGEYPPMRGGVGDYTWCLMDGLLQSNRDLFVLAHPQAQDNRHGVHLTTTRTRWGIRFWLEVRAWSERLELDVINLQFQTSIYSMSPYIHFLPRMLKTPIVTTFHDLLFPYLFPKAGALRSWIVKELAHSSSQSIVTNHEDLARLSYIKNTKLIPIGSNIRVQIPDNAEQKHIRKQWDVDEDTFVVAHFGFLYPNRGAEYLIRAFAQFVQTTPNAKLVFMGGREGGPAKPDYVKQLDELIIELNIAKFVHWTGYLEQIQVSAMLQTVDAVVLPFLDGASYRRGSLMAAIEHACPIITTQPILPIPTFKPEQNMLFVPIANETAIFSALVRLHQQPELRQTLHQQVALLKQEFAWDSITQQFMMVFEDVKKRTP
jgi:polysaccharide biosynthesis protein PslF